VGESLGRQHRNDWNHRKHASSVNHASSSVKREHCSRGPAA
jgi:hypothetical protein